MSDNSFKSSVPIGMSARPNFPPRFRCLKPIYDKAHEYHWSDKKLSLKDLAHSLVCVESCFEIIQECKAFESNDNHFDVEGDEANTESAIIQELSIIFEAIRNDIRFLSASVDYAVYKKFIDASTEEIRPDIITSMAIYYRNAGDSELNKAISLNLPKRKASQYFHIATLFFHWLILNIYEMRKKDHDLDTAHYNKLVSNFNSCRAKLISCSQNLQNLIGEHFIFPKQINNSPSLSESNSSDRHNACVFTHYELCDDGKLVGVGGYGSVFVVRHRVSNIEFACKKISTISMDFRKLGRLHREIAILKELFFHPNIVKLHEVYYDSDCVYLIMELCKVGDLATFVLDKIRRPLFEHEARRILSDIIISIRYLHQQNILHCDIKLENFVLDCSTDIDSLSPTPGVPTHVLYKRQSMKIKELVVKVTDFGLSKYSDALDVPVLSGSVPYLSPEIFNNEAYSAKCDIWSIGIVAFMLLTAKFPFVGNTKSELLSSINGPIPFPNHLSSMAVDFVEKFLKVDPSQRISLEEALEHPFLKDSSSSTTPSYSQPSTPRSNNSQYDSSNLESTELTVPPQCTPNGGLSLMRPDTESSSMGGKTPTGTIIPSDWVQIADSLQSYWSMCKFNKVLCKAVAFSLKPTQISNLRTIFNDLDIDRNGCVSMDELSNVLRANCPEFASEIENSESFQELSKQNMEFSYSDFIAAALTKRICITESQLLMTFELLDQERNGFLSFDAVKRAAGDYLTASEVQDMISTLDKDGDGRIDYHEFITHWRKLNLQRHQTTGKYRHLFRKAFIIAKAIRRFSMSVRSRVSTSPTTTSSSTSAEPTSTESSSPSSQLTDDIHGPQQPLPSQAMSTSTLSDLRSALNRFSTTNVSSDNHITTRSISASIFGTPRETFRSAECDVKSHFYRVEVLSQDLMGNSRVSDVREKRMRESFSNDIFDSHSQTIDLVSDKQPKKRVSFR